MAVLEAMAILLAVAAMAMLPCLVVFIIFADALLRGLRRQRQWIRRSLHRPDDEPVDITSAEPESDPLVPAGPPLEQIADEIHRLTYARRTSAAGSARFIAATRAYDRRLVFACRALEIDQHLDELRSVDLDLERVRVEGLLLDAGFVLDTDSARPA